MKKKASSAFKARLTIAKFWDKHARNVLILFAIIVVAVGAWLFLPGSDDSAADGGSSKDAKARMVANAVAPGLQAELDRIATRVTDAHAAAMLAAGEDMSAFAASITASEPGVIAIGYLQPDSWDYDPAATPPLTYTTLNLLDEAASKAPHAEVQPVGKQQQVTLVRRLVANERTVGFVVVTMTADFISSALAAIEVPKGYFRIVQPVPGGANIELASAGEAWQGSPVSTPIPGTGWRVEHMQKSATANTDDSGGDSLWLIIGVLVLVGGAASYVVLGRRKQRANTGKQVAGGAAKVGADTGEITGNVQKYLDDTGEARPVDPRSADEVTQVKPVTDDNAEQTFSDTAKMHLDAMAGDGIEVSEGSADVPAHIFKAYDIRGAADTEISTDLAERIGRAVGSAAFEAGQQALVVGRDGRNSSEALTRALIEGLRASGRDVIDIGVVATPILYFATRYLDTNSGIMVTASHNPPGDNGFKIMLADELLAEDALQAIYKRVLTEDFSRGEGNLQHMEVDAEYIRQLGEDIPVAFGNAFKIVVDCGNGSASNIAPRLFKALGHDVVELFCSIDGNFPNHHPDPAQEANLKDLQAAVAEHQADIGFAFDGDGDRLGVVDNAGNIIWPDKVMMLFAHTMLKEVSGATIIYDVKCSDKLGKVVKKQGGKPVMSRPGHSLIRAQMREQDALLGGDMAGHFFIKHRWSGNDDSLYAAARLIEILQSLGAKPADVFAKLPGGIATQELRVRVDDGHGFIDKLKANSAAFGDGTLIDIDGIRMEYADGWGLVRASNTMPILTLRFEAKEQAGLERIQAVFRDALLAVDSNLEVPF